MVEKKNINGIEDVYEPMNPIEDLIGGEVKFRHTSGKKPTKRRRR